MTLRRRERQVQEAEERADNLLQSAAAEVDRQSQALEEDRRTLQQQQHAFAQVGNDACSTALRHIMGCKAVKCGRGECLGAHCQPVVCIS